MISAESLVLIGAAALIIFGPKKLPELGKAAGKTLREFKKATQDIMDMDEKSSPSEKKVEASQVKNGDEVVTDPKPESPTNIEKQE